MEADQKRKLACDACKRKKLKCEWEEDKICIRCSKTGTECIPQPTTQRKKREKKPNTYLNSLEDRLKRMEAAVIKSAGSRATTRRSSEDFGNQTMVDNMSLLKINDDGTSVFVGSASGFSIFSPQGLKWISEKTGTNHFSNVINSMPQLTDSSEGTFGTRMWKPLAPEDREPLPSRELAGAYITEFFHGFASIFPLYDKPTFFDRFSKQYPVTLEEDVAWYASLNIVCAMGSIMKDKCRPSQSPSAKSIKPQETTWWKWFRNATSCFVDLQFREASLGAVQALVSMSFLLQTLPDPDLCAVVAGAALRLAQAIGLHRNLSYASLTASEVEQRRNTFWIGLLIERGVAFRLGRPSVIQEDDIGIDFPKSTGAGAINGHLRYMAKLAVLQGRIYNKLYSAKSLTKSTYERLQRIGILDEELQHWRESIPEEIRPGNAILQDESDIHRMVPILMMHFAYYHSLTIIHRVSNQHGPWTHKGEDPFSQKTQESGLNPRAFAGGAICVGAARSVIQLLNLCAQSLDSGDLNVIRVIIYYPLTASLILFANLLQNPWDAQAVQDLALMGNVVDFMQKFCDDHDTPEGEFILLTYREVNKLASDFVNESRLQGVPVAKRGSEHVASVDRRITKRPSESCQGEEWMNAPTQLPINPEYASYSFPTFHGNNPDTSMAPFPTFEPLDTLQSITDNLSSEFKIPFEPPLDSQFLVPPDDSAVFSDLLTFDNDPLTLLDGDQSNEGTPGTATTGEEKSPEWTNQDDILMGPGGSWFFPISNSWDGYTNTGGNGAN